MGNGCDWEINNINFSDFSFRKEDVQVTLGDPAKPNDELLRLTACNISAHFKDLRVFGKQTSFASLQAEGTAHAKAQGMSISIAFKRMHPGSVAGGFVTGGSSPFGMLACSSR